MFWERADFSLWGDGGFYRSSEALPGGLRRWKKDLDFLETVISTFLFTLHFDLHFWIKSIERKPAGTTARVRKKVQKDDKYMTNVRVPFWLWSWGSPEVRPRLGEDAGLSCPEIPNILKFTKQTGGQEQYGKVPTWYELNLKLCYNFLTNFYRCQQ